MAHQVRIGTLASPNEGVQLPNGQSYTTTGQVVTLTDAEFARIDQNDITNGSVVDLGPVFSLGHTIVAAGSLPAGNDGLDLGNGITLFAGQTILVDDATFSKINPNIFTDGFATDGGAVVAAQAPTVGVVRTFAAHAVTAQTESVVRCDASGGAFTQNLPVAPIIGRHYVVIKIDASANAVTVAPSAGTGTINGAATQALAAQYNNLDFVWDGTNWFIST